MCFTTKLRVGKWVSGLASLGYSKFINLLSALQPAYVSHHGKQYSHLNDITYKVER